MKLTAEKITIANHEKFFLYCAVTIGILLLLLQAVFSVDLYRDSAGVYSPMARALSAGNYKEAFHPGIPCLNVILSVPPTVLGIPPEKALGIVSSLFYVGTIPFVYLLLSFFLPGKLASFGSLCFACAPKIIRYSCSALIDSGKIFFVTAALYFLIRYITGKYKSWGDAFLFFLMLGGLSLARSEGIGNAVVLFGCLGLYWCMDSWRERKIQPVLPIAGSFSIWPGCILLRVWINWQVFGMPVFDTRISNGIFSLFHRVSNHAASSVAATGKLRVSWWDLVHQIIRGSYELYALFFLIGLLLIIFNNRDWCRKFWPDAQIPPFMKWNHFYWLFLFVPVSNAILFKASDIAAYRYFLLNIPCLMVFTVTGVYWIWKWAGRFLPSSVLAVGIAVILFFQIQNGATDFFSREARWIYKNGKYLGTLLAAEKDTARIWFKNASREWYYSGLKRAVSPESPDPDPLKFRDFDYVLFYENQEDSKPLKNRKDLQEIKLPDARKLRLFKRIKDE